MSMDIELINDAGNEVFAVIPRASYGWQEDFFLAFDDGLERALNNKPGYASTLVLRLGIGELTKNYYRDGKKNRDLEGPLRVLFQMLVASQDFPDARWRIA